MYCAKCGSKFDPYATKHNGKFVYDLCEACHETMWYKYRKTFISNEISKQKSFCIVCGKIIDPTSHTMKHTKTCHSCREKTNDGIMACIRGVKAFYESILKESSGNLSKQAKSYATVIYECPCDCNKKHNHHFNYLRPFEVIRLCSTCHKKEHIRLSAILKYVIKAEATE